MNTNPLISIIIPVYNGEKHIEKTLKSIIAQDYENIEIILVDDVSKDNTIKIAKKILEDGTKKFKIVERSQNGGQCAARNTGYNAANGEYIIFFDHDDLAEKNFVSSLYKEIKDKNADLVFCGIKHFYENENRYEYEPVNIEKKSLNPEDYLKLWAQRKMLFWSVWNFIFKKSFIDGINLHFNEQCKLGEDTEFVLKAISAASKVSFINEMLYIYVHHTGMTSIKYYKDTKIFDSLLLSRFRSIRPIIRKTKDKKIRDYAVNFYMADSIVTQLTNCAKFNDYKRMKKFLRHKKIRELLLSSIKFVFKKPELFFKALMLLYVPDLYYKMRKGIKK